MKSVESLMHALQGKRLLIFDFDGTVADTTPLHAAAFSEVLAPMGVTVDYPSIAGMKTLDAMRHCLLGAGRAVDESVLAGLVTAKQKSARQMIGQKLQPLPGVDEFLQWARPRFKLAMVTSGSRGTVSLALDKLGYSGWFNPLICADDVAQAKPNAEGFMRALKISGVQAVEGLVFEDSDIGLEAARNAALDVIDVRKISWQELLQNF